MPYIKKEDRESIGIPLDAASRCILSQGDLTYAITRLMHNHLRKQGAIRYSSLSAVRASAQDAADEFYRVVMVRHEDKKKLENGPVSQLDDNRMENIR